MKARAARRGSFCLEGSVSGEDVCIAHQILTRHLKMNVSLGLRARVCPHTGVHFGSLLEVTLAVLCSFHLRIGNATETARDSAEFLDVFARDDQMYSNRIATRPPETSNTKDSDAAAGTSSGVGPLRSRAL